MKKALIDTNIVSAFMRKLVEDADILIAATALCHDLLVVTDNTRHFKRIKGLKVVNWLESKTS